MTLEEAIKYYEKLVYEHNRLKQIKAVTLEECKRAAKWLQVAEWLKELKRRREQDEEKKLFDSGMISEGW